MLAFSNIFVQILFFMGFDIFHTITLQAGRKFSLSKQMLAFSIFLFLMEFHIFYTNTLQAGLRFILSMEVLGLLSPRRCWPFQFIFIQS